MRLHSILFGIFGTLFMSCMQNKDSKNLTIDEVSILEQDFKIENGISVLLDSFMQERLLNKVLVFRLKDYNCSECKGYFLTLYKETRKTTDNIILLSQLSGTRSLSIFKKMTGVKDGIINYNNPIGETDQFLNPYIFLYKGDGIISHTIIPKESDYLQNMQMIGNLLNSSNYVYLKE